MEELSNIPLKYSLVDPSADNREALARELRKMPLQPGPETLHFLRSRIALRSPDPPDEIPPAEDYAHAVLVFSPDRKPAYHAVGCAPTAPAKCMAEAVAGSLGLPRAAAETIVMGYLNGDHTRITTLFASDDRIACDCFLGQTLTAWHVRGCAAGYALASPCDSGTHRTLGPPVIVPLAETWQAMHADMRAALSGYCDGDASALMHGSSVTESPLQPAHYQARIFRHITVFIASARLDECGFAQCRPRLCDAPAPVRSAIMRAWRHVAAGEYRTEVIARQDVQRLWDIMRYHSSSFLYRVRLSECGERCIISVFSQAGRWTHYTPPDGSEAPNGVRWALARRIFVSNVLTPWPGLLRYLEMPEDSPASDQPPRVTRRLKRHQLQNVHFMLRREKETTFHSERYTVLPNLPRGRVLYSDPVTRSTKAITGGDVHATGGFLCDPMGSGKTSSVVALIAANPGRPGDPRATIVVCPSSVIGQWAREIQATAPDLAVCTYHGKTRAGLSAAHLVQNFDVVLTTYTTYVLSIPVLGPVRWHRAVFDEAHAMSAQFAARSPESDRRWCVTATPQKMLDRQMVALRTPKVFNGSPTLVLYTLMPMLIYRTDTEHTAALPPVAETDVPVNFAGEDRDLYQHAFRAARARYDRIDAHSIIDVQGVLRPLLALCAGGVHMSRAMVEPGTAPSPPRARHPDPRLVCPDGECPICYNAFEDPAVTPCGHWFCDVCICTALQRTSRACPMCRRALTPGVVKLGVLGSATATATGSGSGAPAPLDSVPAGSGSVACMSKVDAVVHMLESMRSGDPTGKYLVFSHSNAALKTLRPLLAARGFGVRTIHGGMAAPQRSSAIAAFQTDPRTTVFLLGARAACTGITLTAANHVVIMDPGFDPVEETQCIGRAHRFGQTRDVKVWRMYMRGTVEETMLATRKPCLELARAVFG